MKLHRLLLIFLALTAAGTPSIAEIYTWKDESGKTHFGDKPTTGHAANSAKKMDIDEAYQPTVNLTDTEKAFKKREQAAKNRLAGLRKTQTQAEETAKSEQQTALQDACANFYEQYQDLRGVRVKNGTPTRTYLVNEAGESLSSLEQDALIEEMRKKGVESNCAQFSEN